MFPGDVDSGILLGNPLLIAMGINVIEKFNESTFLELNCTDHPTTLLTRENEILTRVNEVSLRQPRRRFEVESRDEIENEAIQLSRGDSLSMGKTEAEVKASVRSIQLRLMTAMESQSNAERCQALSLTKTRLVGKVRVGLKRLVKARPDVGPKSSCVVVSGLSNKDIDGEATVTPPDIHEVIDELLQSSDEMEMEGDEGSNPGSTPSEVSEMKRKNGAVEFDIKFSRKQKKAHKRELKKELDHLWAETMNVRENIAKALSFDPLVGVASEQVKAIRRRQLLKRSTLYAMAARLGVSRDHEVIQEFINQPVALNEEEVKALQAAFKSSSDDLSLDTDFVSDNYDVNASVSSVSILESLDKSVGASIAKLGLSAKQGEDFRSLVKSFADVERRGTA